jgi:hypothetical protein
MTEAANVYKQATEAVLKRYETDTGDKGQTQGWKVKAIAEDRKSGRLDTSVMTAFVSDVELEVNRILSQTVAPTVAPTPKPKKKVGKTFFGVQ